MTKYVINGLFMTQQMGGLPRYAIELCKALDTLLSGKDVVILVPKHCNASKDSFKNIELIKYGEHMGIRWEQIDLRHFVKKHGYVCINLCNVTPLFIRPGITAVHDLMFKLYPEWFTTFRNKLSSVWHSFQADYAIKHEKYILCTSNFTRGVLEEHYRCARGKVKVVPVGWQHILEFKENSEWEKAYPFLDKKEFYFAMATRSGNKNGRWIMEVAKKNPEKVFAIAGKNYEPEGSVPPNVHMLGFISDEDACSLMKNCRAFICPSFYEGFGDPPMEALALGAQIIVSDRSALPEVFEHAAHYIDPYNTDVDLEALLKGPVQSPRTVLDKYSWDKSAKILYNLMYDNTLRY